jgi:hypothetical protein
MSLLHGDFYRKNFMSRHNKIKVIKIRYQYIISKYLK